MYLREAAIKSLETGQAIYRESALHGKEDTKAYIKPTNSYDCCQLIVMDGSKTRKGTRYWNPTADDLIADDWKLDHSGNRESGSTYMDSKEEAERIAAELNRKKEEGIEP